jgi:polysaccharide export outer membrane protein
MRFAMTIAVALVCGCANLGEYTWVKDYSDPPAPVENEYLIKPGDVLQVRVFNQEGMSARAKVRSDGKISLPFLNDVTAAGHSPNSFAKELQVKLKEFIKVPVVTVSLEETRPITVSVLGEVARQGGYQVEPGTGVLQLLASAGGLTELAHKDRIFVLRHDPSPVRIRFSFEALSRLDDRASSFRVRSGDVVVVE